MPYASIGFDPGFSRNECMLIERIQLIIVISLPGQKGERWKLEPWGINSLGLNL
jgi:hypothetical protein